MSNFTLPLGIESLEITAQTLDGQGNIIFDVKSNKASTRCRICGKSISKVHGHGEVLIIQHLPILDQPVFLRIRVVRCQCTNCDDRPLSSKRYDWVERRSKTTKGFDRSVADFRNEAFKDHTATRRICKARQYDVDCSK